MALRSVQLRGDQRIESAAISDSAHIKRGDRGPYVAKIQSSLNLLDKAGLVADGNFGPATAKAVLDYKKKRRIINHSYQIKEDDIVGRMTVSAMDNELSQLNSSIAAPSVIIGRPIVQYDPPFTYRPTPAKFSVRGNGDNPNSKSVANGTQIRAVIRGNPYVAADAKPFAGVPASVPPGKTYAVDVTIVPPLQDGQSVKMEIINGTSLNGTATISPVLLRASGRVTVTGGDQTEPGHGGQIRIRATLNGEVLATSDGFSVCAHPSGVRIVSAERLAEPPERWIQPHIGIKVHEQLESDSGSVEHLNKVLWNELVEEVQRDSPPFSATGASKVAPFYMAIITGAATDDHGYRPFLGHAGSSVTEQVHIYKCTRCGAKHIPIAASGFEITGKAFTDDKGKTWKFAVSKVPSSTGVIGVPEDGAEKGHFKAAAGLGKEPKVPAEVIPPPP